MRSSSSTPSGMMQPPRPRSKGIHLHSVRHAYACDHEPLAWADCVMHDPAEPSAPPPQCVCVCVCVRLYSSTSSPPRREPSEPGPLGVAVGVETAFLPVGGVLLMGWGNGWPRWAPRDKSDSG